MLVDLIRDHEVPVGIEAEGLLGRPDLVFPEGRTVGGGGVHGVRGGVGDMRAHYDERAVETNAQEELIARFDEWYKGRVG